MQLRCPWGRSISRCLSHVSKDPGDSLLGTNRSQVFASPGNNAPTASSNGCALRASAMIWTISWGLFSPGRISSTLAIPGEWPTSFKWPHLTSMVWSTTLVTPKIGISMTPKRKFLIHPLLFTLSSSSTSITLFIVPFSLKGPFRL